MQVYCNVATAPLRKVAATSGKAYWEFRAAESAKGDSDATWYTVRLFRDEDPGLAKGDFVCVTGKLKIDSFMARDGKPMAIATLLAFALARIGKDGKRQDILALPTTKPAVSSDRAAASRDAGQSVAQSDEQCDNPWLSLV